MEIRRLIKNEILGLSGEQPIRYIIHEELNNLKINLAVNKTGVEDYRTFKFVGIGEAIQGILDYFELLVVPSPIVTLTKYKKEK